MPTAERTIDEGWEQDEDGLSIELSWLFQGYEGRPGDSAHLRDNLQAFGRTHRTTRTPQDDLYT